MKLVALGIIGGALLAGCAGGAPKAQAPHDTLQALDNELSHAIGTTTVTSAAVEETRARPAPMANEWDDVAASLPTALPIDKTFPSAAGPSQTWGDYGKNDMGLANNPFHHD